MRFRLASLALWIALATVGCDRNVEPFDPDEQPQRPDLSRIFPEGAERAARAEPALPAAPGRGAPPLAAAAARESGGEAGPPIAGAVRVAEALAASVPPGAVLFVVARSNAGGGPPLAVKRIPDPSFPVEFRIGPEDRMIQAMPFTGPFRLSARVDSDGDAATRSPGDLQGAIDDPVPAGTTNIDLVLDERL